MTVWHIRVHLVRHLQGDAARHQLQAALPTLTAFGREVTQDQEFLDIDQDAPCRSDAITAVTAAVEAVLGAQAIDRVGGADDLMQERQVLLWVRGTRRQLRRWEVALAANVRAHLAGRSPEPWEIWDLQIENHLALVAANNVLRAVENADERFTAMDAALARDLRNQRDLHEHWDEQWPAFYNSREPGPLKRGGVLFAANHPGKSPFSFLSWSSKDGPRLGPGLLLADLYSYLNNLEGEVLAIAPRLERFISSMDPSPWIDDPGTDGLHVDHRWWPRDSTTRRKQ